MSYMEITIPAKIPARVKSDVRRGEGQSPFDFICVIKENLTLGQEG